MKTNSRMVLGVVLLAVFGALAFLNFNRTIAPYVGFNEAKASTGAVQVAGFPDHQKATYDPSSGTFSFYMDDGEGQDLTVNYKGVKPGNFDQAQKVVVVGRYQDGVLNASQILVKCPSKYDDESSASLKSGSKTDYGKDAETD